MIEPGFEPSRGTDHREANLLHSLRLHYIRSEPHGSAIAAAALVRASATKPCKSETWVKPEEMPNVTASFHKGETGPGGGRWSPGQAPSRLTLCRKGLRHISFPEGKTGESASATGQTPGSSWPAVWWDLARRGPATQGSGSLRELNVDAHTDKAPSTVSGAQ